jgi:hypothetical protein
MIKTSIILGIQDGFPIWSPCDGFAKNLSIAKWLFSFCGWKNEQSTYPELTYQIATVDCSEGAVFYFYDPTKLYVLGKCIFLN